MKLNITIWINSNSFPMNTYSKMKMFILITNTYLCFSCCLNLRVFMKNYSFTILFIRQYKSKRITIFWIFCLTKNYTRKNFRLLLSCFTSLIITIFILWRVNFPVKIIFDIVWRNFSIIIIRLINSYSILLSICKLTNLFIAIRKINSPYTLLSIINPWSYNFNLIIKKYGSFTMFKILFIFLQYFTNIMTIIIINSHSIIVKWFKLFFNLQFYKHLFFSFFYKFNPFFKLFWLLLKFFISFF